MFGTNVLVLPGINIGNNVIIGAGSIITKNIPDNCIAYGIPCKKKDNMKKSPWGVLSADIFSSISIIFRFCSYDRQWEV